ncbi:MULTISPECIES: coproporphyrinogen dehydrogenase HemZ [unclassified Sedimentibacter]|uniref:coproporphyrinogen dehydrogenase HemZ n=1 Tax=unclassified Sedimentibacter TaxID=2649220 RepID=UPI0027E153D5|nr:coproporphyrinogen dehydrogenase HemZ [Sedimentibacter sp. MB35-C1]WMJ75820.1 coproporphyrinogen dehydrogenase HemZ [Sedimentibacter sp. MB35-C1]
MKVLTFYFSGHNFEYEARNDLRIFDLNIGYEVKLSGKSYNDTGLAMVSVLNDDGNSLISTACLYLNDQLLFRAEYESDEIFLESADSKRLKKILVVKSIHSVLKRYYGVNPEYGILTGVRVVKILITALKHGKTKKETTKILKDTYEVLPEKIDLLWEVLDIERKYVNEEENKQNYNLYAGIPFCPSKCSYCSFTSYTGAKEDKIDKYIDVLVYEIEETIKMALRRGLKLHTIYIGGGTPSVLNERQISVIFDCIKKYYDLAEIKEVMFEAGRPDTLTEEKLIFLKETGVNRISINPQTMNEKTLEIIGRKHSSEDIVNKYNLARKTGFDWINTDIILGLPGEDEADVNYTIREIIKLRPENITVHSLAYKTKSELTRQSEELRKDYDLIQKMYEVVKKECIDSGYIPYYMYRQKNIKGNSENIGYTLPEKESLYNIVIIEELETILACGLGASSKIKKQDGRHVPLRNFKSLEEYEGRIEEILQKKKRLLFDKKEIV